MSSMMQVLVSVFRLGVWLALLAVIFLPLERLLELRPRQGARSGLVVDIAYYFLSGLLPALILSVPTAFLAMTFQRFAPAGWLGWSAALPGWARAGLTLLVAEFGAYWGHRWSHQVPLLWRFHAIHHQPAALDWLVHTRAHPLDMVFVRLCALLPVFALGLAQPSGEGVRFAALATIVGTIWGFVLHANVRCRLGFLEQWVASPFFHHWHHSRAAPLDRNFAATLPIFDRLFGTFHLPSDWPVAYGSDTAVPPRFAMQLLEPLLPTRKTTLS